MAVMLLLASAPYGYGFGPAPPPLPPIVPSNGPFPARMAVQLPGVESLAPYKFYSGYIDAGTPPSGFGTMYFHYICAMAPDWQNMPLTIWYNGGPGAPSTFGMFQVRDSRPRRGVCGEAAFALAEREAAGVASLHHYLACVFFVQEFGPFLLNADSLRTEAYKKTGVPTPLFNAWTWANATSLCEIDSPPPMGASFCSEGNGTQGSTGGDSYCPPRVNSV